MIYTAVALVILGLMDEKYALAGIIGLLIYQMGNN